MSSFLGNLIQTQFCNFVLMLLFAIRDFPLTTDTEGIILLVLEVAASIFLSVYAQTENSANHQRMGKPKTRLRGEGRRGLCRGAAHFTSTPSQHLAHRLAQSGYPVTIWQHREGAGPHLEGQMTNWSLGSPREGRNTEQGWGPSWTGLIGYFKSCCKEQWLIWTGVVMLLFFNIIFTSWQCSCDWEILCH